MGKVWTALEQHPDLRVYLLRASPDSNDALEHIDTWLISSIRLDGPAKPKPPDLPARPRPADNRLKRLLDSLPPALEEEVDWWLFDPDRDSIGSIIEQLEQRCRDDAGTSSEDFEGWADGGLKWLRETVGINFSELQERWREVFFVVPQHVSDKYAQYQSRGLLVYLDQIKLAYIVGADLSAVALCRATTEVLIRTHYASDFPHAEDTNKTKLTGDLSLIRHAENNFGFLRYFNLYDKVVRANEILHKPKLNKAEAPQNSIGRTHPEPERELARGWIRALEQMIGKAPGSG